MLAGEGTSSDGQVDIYQVFSISTDATKVQVTKAYRKLALKYHPDKVSPEERDAATLKFQDINEYYAILIDDTRRGIYDKTGSLSDAKEGVDVNGDMSWDDYFATLFDKDGISKEKIEEFLTDYRGSKDEKSDLISAYTEFKGDMDQVLDNIMGSTLDDEDRFREIVSEVVKEGEVKKHAKFFKKDKKATERRRKQAQEEAKEADELAQKLGLDKVKGDGDDALKQLMMQRNEQRMTGFFDDLEAKYAPKHKSKNASSGAKSAISKRKTQEPTEEEFLKIQENMLKGKATTAEPKKKRTRKS